MTQLEKAREEIKYKVWAIGCYGQHYGRIYMVPIPTPAQPHLTAIKQP